MGVPLLLVLFGLLQITCSQLMTFQVDTAPEINEEQPVGEIVVDININYLDAGFNLFNEEYGSYDFEAGFDEQFFSIDSSNGIIRFATVLDIDEPDSKFQYTLKVRFTASDGAIGTEEITINLQDINDNTPTFNQTQYQVTLPENAEVGFVVFTAIANDLDQVISELILDEETLDIIGVNYTNANGRVLYSILNGNDDNQFAINPETGNVTVAPGSTIDVDERDFYNLTILAKDGGGLTNTSLLLITVLDSNDNRPIIEYPTNFTINLSEDTPPGLVIVEYINATDDDYGINSEIRFAVIAGDITNSFAIDVLTGMLILTGELDREAQNPLLLTIAAIDQGIPQLQDTLVITIDLLDVNDQAPVFQQSEYNFEVEENSQLGTSVGIVIAIDMDEGSGGIVNYYLQEPSSHFAINNSSGVITTINDDLDRETQSHYTLIVTAIDNPTNKSLVLNSSVIVNIALADMNDNIPQWSEVSYSVGILDTEEPGYMLVVIQATDADIGSNGQVSYEFFGDHDPTFEIDSNSGAVTLSEDLDFTVKSEYVYTVRAYDGAIVSGDNVVSLTIIVHTPNIKSPKFSIKTHNLTISEETAVGDAILNVTATDNDPGLIGQVYYRIYDESVFDGSGSFDVGLNTGTVFVSKKLNYDYKETKYIFFQVEAYDGGFPQPFTAYSNITVYLTNTNDEAPKIIIPPENIPTIPENMPPNIAFAELMNFTIDEDPGDGGLFEYTLVNVYDDDENSFNITADGILIALRTFDREENPEGFILAIETTDFGAIPNSLINNVTVLIGDANDEIPFFESNASALVYEFRLPGEVVIVNYTAIDDDIGQNAELNYAITDGDTTDSFTIDSSGTITTTKPLNKTEQRYYTLTILAMDNGQIPLYDYGEVFVEVIDLNDNAPIFEEPLIAYFNENDADGFVFYQLNATDPDEGTNSQIVYYLSDESINNFTRFDNATNTTVVRFSVDESSGNVSIHDSFDREIESEFQLIIIAIDLGVVPGMLNTSVTLTVLLEDFNDQAPVFLNESYSFYVIENANIGTSIGYVFAEDNDADEPNNEFQFSLTSLWEDDNVTIDNVTGLMTVSGIIDWEQASVIEVIAYVIDEGDPSLSSTVNIAVFIEDINDQAPKWNETTLNLSISENLAINSYAGFVEAVDADSLGNNSLIYYTIVEDLDYEYFEIDETTGEIMSLASFDREEVDGYSLIVVAFDSGSPQMSSSATLSIEIADQNDNNPYFFQTEYNTTISENTPIGTIIINLQASDSDIDENAILNYRIPSTENWFFAVDKSTGGLYVNATLDYESTVYFEFEVVVENYGLQSRNDSAIVKITIADYNDEVPVFEQQEYNITLVENIAIGSNLLQIQSSDIDSDTITYSLEQSFASMHFGIDPTIGMIYTIDFFDREVLGSNTELIVIANNSAELINPLSSSVSVYITILDVNDESPTFEPYIIVPIPENSTDSSVIYTLKAEDGDEGMNGTVLYEIANGNDGNMFSINKTTGELHLLGVLDYEKKKYHYIGVNATDQANDPLHGYTTIIIEVTDTNDNQPVFAASTYVVTTQYTTSVGTNVLKVSAFDGDNDLIEYTIVDGNNDNLFDISSSTGQVYVKNSLSGFPDVTINITIKAHDGTYNDTAVAMVRIRGIGSTVYFTSISYEATTIEGSDDSTILDNFYSKVSSPSQSNQFHIVEGNQNGIFALSTDGLLTVADGSQLDYEIKPFYQLSISVNSVSYTVINIVIEDRNEFFPNFSSASFHAPVYETVAKKIPFFVILAEDEDGSSPPNEVKYAILSGNDDGKFLINTNNGELSLNKMLDFDIDEHIYTLNVSAQNTDSTPNYLEWTLVTVELLNGNRHAPVLSSLIYSVEIDENISEGTPINIIVSAFDTDDNQQSNVTYTLLGDHRHYDFEIDEANGTITVGPGGIDFERQETYTLTAVASDDGLPTKTSTALVVVIIRDLNDNSPVWEQQQYNAVISETLEPGVIFTVLATDADQTDYSFINNIITFDNQNGLVLYSITAGDPKSQFGIDRDINTPDARASVSVLSVLDREDISEYNLTITATDGGGRSTDAYAYILLTDKNDFMPIFNYSAYNISISEDFEIGSLVAHISAIDEDLLENSQLTYSITSGNINGAFSIKSSTGEIFLEKLLDREVLSNYVVGINAVDSGKNVQLTGTTTLYIHVLDENEFAPEFDEPSYAASVAEDIPFDYLIIKTMATDIDIDLNGKIIYSITNSSVSNQFMINSTSGEIYLNDELDYELYQVHYLTVTASDSGPTEEQLYSDVEVIITILDVNDNVPIFDQLQYETDVFEDAVPLTGILELRADDVDTGLNAEIRYSLDFEGDIDAANIFLIDELTGELNLSNNTFLDYEEREVYEFFVLATDLGSPALSSNVSVSVYVQDINDNAPSFDQTIYQGYVIENILADEEVLVVNSTDPDSNENGEVTYTLIKTLTNTKECLEMCPTAANICQTAFPVNNSISLTDSLFEIDNTTGVLTTSATFDRESIDKYIIVLMATDSSIDDEQLSNTSCAVIEVLDENDEIPVFLNLPNTTSVIEEQASVIMVFTVSATDDDIGINAKITYELVDHTDIFTINPNTGEIYTITSLDRESIQSYNITIIAKDQGNPPNTAIAHLYIEVTDINDSPPLFEYSQYEIFISEDATIGTLVNTTMATDSDTGANSDIEYYFISIMPESHFDINSTTGEIYVTSGLDRETYSTYSVTVLAKDSGIVPLNSTTIINININDVNDNIPVFSMEVYFISIDEESLELDPIITVSASDVDIGDNSLVHYSIVNSTFMFSINETSGDIFLEDMLDSEISLSINITVVAENVFAVPQLKSSAIVTVNVIDINDNYPVFTDSQYYLTVAELTPVGSIIFKVTTIDLDATVQNRNMLFSIVNSTDNDYFGINSKSGEIYVARELDSDEVNGTAVHTFSVLVEDSDGFSSTTTVTVALTNINDNPPVYLQYSYNFSIPENEPIGSFIGTVYAIDADNDVVSYFIFDDNEDYEVFSIDNSTGKIFSDFVFDREQQDYYILNVTAIDDLTDGTYVDVLVYVNIVDINDNRPIFENDSYTVSIAENATLNEFIINVNAYDSDLAENSIPVYSIVDDSNFSDYFYIDKVTGDVLLNHNLNREEKDFIKITLVATDTLDQILTSTSTLSIHITDVNDNIPIFESSLYNATLLEDADTGTQVSIVSATDADIDNNALISYSIENDFQYLLYVNESSGVITLISPLDYEIARNYSIQIFASDDGFPVLQSVSTLLITVVDLNDNSPYFEQQSYSFSVPENSVLDTSVFLVPAIDIDDGLNSKLQYTILSGNIGFFFNLNEDTGIITVADYIDYEINQNFELEVQVVDLGIPQYTAVTTIQVSIEDVNDNFPQFSESIYYASVSENATIGANIVSLIVIDQDSGTNADITFSITSGNMNNTFNINNDGYVIVNSKLDSEKQSSYSLMITASDNGLPQLNSMSQLIISLIEVNEYAPVLYSNNYYLNVSQATAIGTALAYLSAYDTDDETTTITYTVTTSTSNSFSITSQGELYVYSPLSVGTFTLTIAISDGLNTNNLFIEISVYSQSYDGPRFEHPTYQFDINEGISVMIIAFADSNFDSIHFLSAEGENTQTIIPFSIDQMGIVHLSAELDREEFENYVLNVKIVKDGLEVYTILTINVIDINDNLPLFSSDIYMLTLSEQTLIDTTVLTLTANDLDTPGPNSDITFSLEDDEYFVIDSVTNTLVLTHELDREVIDIITVTVVANNSKADPILFSTAKIIVTVQDENDNSPEFESIFYNVNVFDSTEIGTKIIKVVASDSDDGKNAELVYTITYQSSPESFVINRTSGMIYTNREFDNDIDNDISLSIMVSDQGIPTPRTDTAMVFVTVLKDNLYGPVFSQENGYNLTIEETIDIDTSITDITATDEDGDTVTYSIDGTVPFTISPLTGVIRVSNDVDYLQQPFYTFSVLATDNGSPERQESTVVNISLIDVNNHSPVFTANEYQASILENVDIGTFVTQVMAKDLDTTFITYTITVNYEEDGINLFRINDTTGEIVTNGHINRESVDNIELLVSAIDNGYPVQRSTSTEVIISIEDINDENPIFVPFQYDVNVIRLSPANYSVVKITAYDTDITSDEIQYNIVFQTINDLFAIDSPTGSLATFSEIPEDVKNETIIIVSAFDGNQTSNVTVNVKAVTNGTFCENGFCTVVVERSLECNYAIPEFPICTTYCESDLVLSPKKWLCMKYYCSNDMLVPCQSQRQCLLSNEACSGICPQGQSICQTTNLCYPESSTTLCDDNICLVGQTLVQSDDGTRSCATSSSLSQVGQACTEHGYIYCTEIDTCSNLTAPHLCKLCPAGEMACDDTKVCVNDTKYCCGTNGYYCDALSTCISIDELCKLPNIAPTITQHLVYYGTIESILSDQNGKMIGTLLGNADNLATDDQGEEIGLAVIETSEVNSSLGEWQYAECFSDIDTCKQCSNVSLWKSIGGNVSESSALFLSNTACLRFQRKTLFLVGASWLRVKAWDGNQDGYISSEKTLVRYQHPFIASTISTTSVSYNSTLVTVLLLPVNSYPIIENNNPQLTPIAENIELQMNIGDSVNDITASISLEYLPILEINTINGLPLLDGHGISIDYTKHFPSMIIDTYYNTLESANPIRSDRLSTNQMPGIAVQLYPKDSGDGIWQVSLSGDPQLYTYLTDIIDATGNLLLLNTSSSIRYIPNLYFEGVATLAIYPWDGILPQSSIKHNINDITAYTASLIDFSSNSLNNVSYLTVSVVQEEQPPLITASSVLLTPIAYAMKFFFYDSSFTITVMKNYDELEMDASNIENILHLVLDSQVTVHSIFPASNSKSYIIFSVDDNSLSISDIQMSINAKKETLNEFLPIVDFTQDAVYGSSISCDATSQNEVTGDFVYSLMSQLATDFDGDYVGMIVTDANYGDGVWQYSRGNWSDTYPTDSSGIWINLPASLSEQSGLLLHANDKIRYIPKPQYYWNSNFPLLTVKAWDNSLGDVSSDEPSLTNINTDPYTDTIHSIHKPVGRFSDATAMIMASRFGCDGNINSGLEYDACCICGGSGSTCNGCDGIANSNKVLDGCGECGGTDSTCLGCDGIPFSFSSYGSCSECISIIVNNTGSEIDNFFSSDSFKDCSNTCFGSALVDDCGVCSAGNTDHQYNEDMDCFDVCFGENIIDECNYCTGPDTGLDYNQYLDCTGVCDGPFRADSCNICQLPDLNGEIVEHADCNGTCFGSAKLDVCGICYGGSTGIPENSVLDDCGICYGNNTCYGCDGILNSGKIIDNCGVCGGNDCGCQKVVKAFPNQGPASGGTQIVITGSGFFLNDSNYDPSQFNCNASTETNGGKSVPATCRFVSQQEAAFGEANIVDQSTINCLTPTVTLVDNNFALSIRIENGQYTTPIPFTFLSYTNVEIIDRFPSMGMLNSENTVTFLGNNFLNNGLQSCLLSDISSCNSGLTTNSNGYHVVLAEFVSESEITCALPIIDTSCQISIHLSFDGQGSGIIVYPESLMEKYVYAFSAPNVTSIYFSNDLTTLVVEFDRSVHISGNQAITCYHVFDKATLDLISQNALCNWGTVQQNSIHVQLPVDANVKVGSPIDFRKEAILSNGTDFSFAVSNTLYVSTAVPPAIVLEGPSIVPSCGSVRYTAINTYFEGYKTFTYKWGVHTLNSSIAGMKEIASYINDLPTTASTITLSSGLFQSSMAYIVQVVVTNAVGLTSTHNVELTKKIPVSLKVSISSPDSQTVYIEQNVILHATIVNDDCVNFQSFNFEWKLYKLVDERRSIYEVQEFDELITTNSLLYIPGGVLMPGTSYRILVSVASGNSHVDTDTVYILTRDEKCLAKIHGGNRTLSSDQTLLLDGGTSVETMKGPVKYVWQCSVVSSGLPCYNASIHDALKPLLLPFEKQISIPSSHLTVGLDYKFTLTLAQDTCESAISTIISVLPSLNPPAIVEILTPSSYFIPSQKIVIEGLVLPNKPVDITWECLQLQDHSYVALEAGILLSPSHYSAIAESEIADYNDVIIIGKTSMVNLIIKPWTLSGSLPYTFQLTARYMDSVVTSTITIAPDMVPKIHSFTVSPTSGIELNTIFKLHVDHVTEDVYDYPIYFQYGVVYNGDYYWLTGLTNERVLDTYLPTDSPTVVTVRVYSNNGGYSETFSEVQVTSSKSTNYAEFIQDLQNDLDITQDWTITLKSFQTMLISISANDISQNLEDSIVNLFYEIFNNYVPFNEANAMTAFSTIRQMVNKVPNMSYNNRITLLNMISNILTAIDKLLSYNFDVIQGLSDPIAIQLRSNRFNKSSFIEAIETESIESAFRSTIILTSDWNTAYALKETQIRQKLHNILCKQTLFGETATSLQVNQHELNFLKGIPFGKFDISYSSSAFVELNNGFLEIYNELTTCSDLNTACSETCIQLTTKTNDYFASTSDNVVTLSSSVRETISLNIPGSDPNSVQLISEIVSFDFSLPSSSEYIVVLNNFNANIKVRIPVTSVNPNNSIPICMFRHTSTSNGHGEWEIDTLNPPSMSIINGINYYTCEYNHLSEFAVGLLPPPIIPVSSSVISFYSSIAQLPTSSLILVTSPSPSPVITPPEIIPYNAAPAAVGGVLAFILLLFVVAIVFIVGVVIWWKKNKSGKAKVVPIEEVELTAASKSSFVFEETSPTPEPVKITLGVIQLKENGERTPLGSLDVAKSTRLRELRNLLCDNFSQLRNIAFYLCTKELSDIEPATEQQQFVSIVYGNIAYVREVRIANENIKKQFCVCNKVAQFECSKCSERGYCSQECQNQDWETNHKRECSRVVERRNRTDILRRQSSQQIGDETDAASRRQSATSWSAFMNQSKSYQTLPKSPTSTKLPPLSLNSNTKFSTIEESDELLLRKQLDSTEQTLVPPAKKIPPPTTLPRLTSRTSVGQLASQASVGQLTSPNNMHRQSRPMISPIASRSTFPVSQRLSVVSSSSIPPIQTRTSIQELHNQQIQMQQQSQLPLFRRPSQLSMQAVPNPQLQQQISVSSILSYDGLSPRPTIRQEPLLEVNEEDSSSSSSDDENNNADDSRVPSTRPPSLAVRKRSSSQLKSGPMEESQSSSDSFSSSSEDEQ